MKKYFLVILLLMVASASLFATIILTGDNPSVMDKNSSLTLTLEVSQGFAGTQNGYLFIRPFGNLAFAKYEMIRGNESNPTYTYKVDDLSSFGRGFEYYFLTLSIDGSYTSFPEYEPKINPLKMELEEKLDYDPAIIKMSPDSKSVLEKDFVIAISYYNLKDKISKKDIKLFLDGQDITGKASISSDMIVYKQKSVRNGIHRYYLKLKTKKGKIIKSKIWETSVKSKTIDLPFELNSSASINHQGNAVSYDNTDSNTSQTNFRFATSVKRDWIGFKSYLYLSSLQREYRQNVNRFNFDINMPYFNLNLGDYSPNIADLVMNNHNIRGVSADFHVKGFRLVVNSGELFRKIDGKMSVVAATDTTLADTTYSVGTFKQNNLSALLELGTKNGLRWGLSFAKNKDKISSLDEKYYMENDSTYMNTPQDNLIAGMHVKVSLLRRRLNFGAESAMSVYNPNIIGGALSADSLEETYGSISLPLDPVDFENFYVYNLNSQPLKPGINNVAYKGYLNFLLFRNYFNFDYSVVGAAYKSLTASYIDTDSKTINIYDNFNYVKYLNVTLGTRLTSDNVNKTKDITNYITNYYFMTSYNSPDYPSFSVSFNKTLSDNKNDIKIGANSFRIATGYQFGNIPKVPTKISLNFSNFDNDDLLNKVFENKRKILGFKSISYFDDLPLITTFNFNYGMNNSTTQIDSLNTDNSYTIFTMKNDVKLMEDRLKPYFLFSLKNFSGDSGKQSSGIFRLGTSYTVYRNTNIYSDFGYVSYKNADDKLLDHSTVNWNMTISYKF